MVDALLYVNVQTFAWRFIHKSVGVYIVFFFLFSHFGVLSTCTKLQDIYPYIASIRNVESILSYYKCSTF